MLENLHVLSESTYVRTPFGQTNITLCFADFRILEPFCFIAAFRELRGGSPAVGVTLDLPVVVEFLARTANKTPFGRAPAATEIILARLSGAVCSESQVFSQFLAVAYAGLADGAAGPRDLRSWFVANRSFSADGSGALLRKTQFSSAERHRPAARGSDGSAWGAPGRAWVGENSDLQNRRPHRCRWAPQSGFCIALRGGRKAELSLPVVHSRGGKLNNGDQRSPSSERSEHRRRVPEDEFFRR